MSTKVFLALAIVSGTSAFALVRGYAERLEALRPAVGPRVPVVAASRPVIRGSVLDAEDLTLVEVPEAFAPSVALRSTADAVGRVTLADLAPGEIVTGTRISDGRAGPLAALVPPGLRALAIAVHTPVDGLVSGDRVDVIAASGGGRPYAETVAESLEVLRPPAPAHESFAGGVEDTTMVVLTDVVTAERLARAGADAALTIAVIGPDHAAPGPEPTGG
jgi:Flp pilus assembly protein CpaB